MDGLPGKVCHVRVWPSGQHLELRISFKLLLRDGPLAGEVQKKYSRKGKLHEKKFMHAN